MDRKVIVLLFLVVVASGCADEQSQQGIAVKELSIEPSSIIEGSSAAVTLEVVNAGLMKGTVDIGSKEKGNRILTNYCSDIFSIEEFRASSSRAADTKSVYTVGKGERIRMYWRLEQDKGRIPLPGYTCNLRFQIPFNYSVRTYKQIQVKKNREVKTAELRSDTSAGPLGIDMAIIGSTAESEGVFLNEDNATLYITTYNKGGTSEDSPYLGLIRIGDLKVEASGGNGSINISNTDECLGTAELGSGSKNIYRCNIEVDKFSSPSIRGEISAWINYTYVRDLGDRPLKVKNRG